MNGERGVVTRLWKVGTRRGMAYAEGRELAERILAAAQPGAVSALTAANGLLPKGKGTKGAAEQLLPGTMAVYSDRKGKPFAWQIAFDVQLWDTVSALLEDVRP